MRHSDLDLPKIPPINTEILQAAVLRHGQLTKPAGSLGRLEELAFQLAAITGELRPSLSHKTVLIMAADHGITTEGVSAFPAEVTPQMVLNFLHGGAAINVLARQSGARVLVVDVGVNAELPSHEMLLSKTIARATQNMALGPAMTRSQALAAIKIGIDCVYAEKKRGLNLLATGEMGIGNTSASAAITAAILRRPVSEVTGRGTGIDETTFSKKIATLEKALRVNEPNSADTLDVVTKVGGFEIAALAGAIIGAASVKVPIILDGFISGAAALVAHGLSPEIRPYLIAGHQSVEQGHRLILEHLGLSPLLNLNLRLGEGTGAVLSFHLIEAAVRILNEMATFEEAKVAGRK